MRIAVISDIHNNLAALEAAVADLKTQAPDLVLVAGDVINRGPQPREVFERIIASGWPLLRGNHEDYILAQWCSFGDGDPLANPIWQPARWTAEQIGNRTAQIAPLPIRMSLEGPAGRKVLIVHGLPEVNTNGIFEWTSDDEIRALFASTGEPMPDLFICAHTHVPLLRQVDGTLVMNVGATGLPFNGDPRAQYGIATWRDGSWMAELRAVEYNRQATIDAFSTNGFLRDGGPLARVILHELETARPHLVPWVKRYAEEVRGGRLSVQEATERYFEEI